jgi:hypothetical protein
MVCECELGPEIVGLGREGRDGAMMGDVEM